MSTTPPVNRFLFFFFVILTLVVGAAALVWPEVRSYTYAPLRDILFPNLFLPTRAGMPVTLTVAAPPALDDWVKANAADYSQQNALIQVNVVQLDGMDANRGLNTFTAQPDVWIAEADFVRLFMGNIPYDLKGTPVAKNTLTWVASQNQPATSVSMNWTGLSKVVKNNPAFRIAMPPVNSIDGMAACWSAAAEYHHVVNVTAAQINDPAFRNWLSAMLQAAPDRNRSPLDQLATRPPQADMGLILASDRQQLSQSLFLFQALDSQVVINYPYTIRTGWPEIQPDEAAARRSAAEKFKNYLLSSGPQGKLSAYGIEPANTHLPGQTLGVDEQAIGSLRFCWQ